MAKPERHFLTISRGNNPVMIYCIRCIGFIGTSGPHVARICPTARIIYGNAIDLHEKRGSHKKIQETSDCTAIDMKLSLTNAV